MCFRLAGRSKAVTTRKVADISQVPPRSPRCQAQTVPVTRWSLPPHPPGRHHQMVQGQIRCHRKVNIFEAKKTKKFFGWFKVGGMLGLFFFFHHIFFFPFPCPYRGTPICTLNKTGNIWYEIQSMSHLLALFGTQKEISSSRSIGGLPSGFPSSAQASGCISFRLELSIARRGCTMASVFMWMETYLQDTWVKLKYTLEVLGNYWCTLRVSVKLGSNLVL